MRRLLSFLILLAISTAPSWAKEGGAGMPAVKALARSSPTVEQLGAVQAAKGLTDAGVKGGPTCVDNFISCNSTVNGVLQTTDCLLEEETQNTYVDFWFFDGSQGDQVTIDLISDDFDTYLFLLDPTPEVVWFDDDGGNGTNSRIIWDVDVSGEWAIAVNNLFETGGDPGGYTLTLTCMTGTVTPPAAPSNLVATTLSSTEIDLFWQDNSNNEEDFEVQLSTGGGFDTIGAVPADSIGAAVSNLQPDTTYRFRVRARNAAGNSGFSNVATATTDADGPPPPPPPPPPGDCIADTTTMCLNDGRFRVRVGWRDFGDTTGSAEVVQQVGSDDSGLFFFFAAENWEMLVKVLNGCSINNHYWVFAAATTNVEYTMRVTDTETGVSQQYFNPLGQASDAITDTSAFATCP